MYLPLLRRPMSTRSSYAKCFLVPSSSSFSSGCVRFFVVFRSLFDRCVFFLCVWQLFDNAGKARYQEESNSTATHEGCTMCSLFFAPYEVCGWCVSMILRVCVSLIVCASINLWLCVHDLLNHVLAVLCAVRGVWVVSLFMICGYCVSLICMCRLFVGWVCG